MNHFYADLPSAQLSLGRATAQTSCNFGHQAKSRLLSAPSANSGKRDGANLACPLFAAAVLPAVQGRSSPQQRTFAGDGARKGLGEAAVEEAGRRNPSLARA
jgi:hypothetical protein